MSLILQYRVFVGGTAASSGCGAGTSNSDCGNVGNPYADYPGGVQPDESGWTAESACFADTGAGSTSYYLTGNVGADPTATCITLKSGDTLDMRGFTVTGRIVRSGNTNAMLIFNGTVNCNSDDAGGGQGCITLTGDRSVTTLTRVHHLTVSNSNTTATTSARAIHLESTATTPGAGYKADHLTIVVPQGASNVSRTAGINFTSRDNIEANNNDITCPTVSNACNAIQAIDSLVASVQSLIHNNLIAMNGVGNLETGRGIAIQGPDSGTTSSSGWQVYNNDCTANENRCFRVRQTAGATFSGNVVHNCQNTSSGCYHLGDPDTSNNVVNINTAITNETIEIAGGGTAFYASNAQGISIKDSTITGTSGRLGNITWLAGHVTATDVTFCRITGASSLGTNSNVNTGATVHLFQAGTWGGTGTIDNLGSC